MQKVVEPVIVTVGAIQVYKQAMRYLRYSGEVITVGIPHIGELKKSRTRPSIFHSIRDDRIKMGDIVLQRGISWIIDFYRQGRFKFELISNR